MKTIRQRLLLGLLGATLLCTLGASALLYRALLEETNELADLQLRQLAVALPNEFAPNSALPAPEDPEEEVVIQAWDLHGRPLNVLPAAQLLPRYAVQGFAVVQFHGARWRIYGQSRNARHIQISQPQAVRDRLAASMAWRASLPLLVFVLLLCVMVVLVVRRALSPLEDMAQTLAQRAPGSAEPLTETGLPPELIPMARAINSLLAKFDTALATQRTFVADAAHELRSPITALKLQLQLAERAGSEAARASAFAKLHERLDRCTHLVHQLLSLARHEPGHLAPQLRQVDLAQLLEAVAIDHATLADSKEIDLGVEAPVALHLLADHEGLRVLLNNLLDNALRYTQHGGRVDLMSGLEDGRVILRVTDNGPGVASEHHAKLFDRFFRPEGHTVWGCGLGLSIVRNIAQHHGADIHLASGHQGRGLSVTVAFPLSAPTQAA